MAVELEKEKFPPLLARIDFMKGNSIRKIAKDNSIPEQEVEDALRYVIKEFLDYHRRPF